MPSIDADTPLPSRRATLSPEPRRSRNGTPRRRRSSTGAVEQHDVADEELPDDAFHSPEFQGAFRDAKQLMSNIQSVLGSSNIHEAHESTMGKLHEDAGRLAAFEYPATRTVGFVGDSGVGKSLFRDTLDIRVNLFSIEELQDQLGRLLQVYRTFELHRDEITDAAERQDMEANAKVAKDTFQAMFRGRLTDEAFLIRESYGDVLDRLTRWAADARPSPLRTWTGLSPQVCSNILMALSSEPASRDSPATWPYIRSINRGLILVDLPGLRDLNSARRIITERYLLECNEIFAICNIGRAATDEGVHQVFDLADRARLSNVGIDIDPEESIRDWPGRRARHIEQLLEYIETTNKEIEELKADIEDYEAADLSEHERRELAECREDLRQARLKEYLITTRNRIIIDSLTNTYAGRVTDSRVFCVSNTIYWQNRTARKSEAERYLHLSGILQVRKHCISIVANSQRRIATQYMKDQIPALLADIELWVQSGARTASEERREALCQTLDSVERRLRKWHHKEHDSVDSLTQALEHRQSIFLAAIEKVNDDFENNLRGALSDEDLFTKLMRSLKDSFRASSEATQAKIQEATVEYLRVIEERFDLVRGENVARESEQDPDFRLRVDQVARAGRETMQRVHQVI
ncbi:hypothetical protein BFJ70_g2433 [Fusarium oxysporum]|nr:hypothetical protein BFJ70_g2433 [Fusarium oxysporum]